MKVIISGGGTGGHISPGIALAEGIIKQNGNNQVLFIGATGKMEMSLVPAAGYRIIGLPIRGIAREKIYKNLLWPIYLLRSLWKARQILKIFTPDVVIGTGGYASFPTIYVAAYMKIPVVLQEQNAYPGIANKFLAKYATKICVAYENMDAYFPPKKVVLTGNPIRSSLLHNHTENCLAHQHFGLKPGVPTILILGGSLGASTLVNCILGASQIFADHQVQVLISVGEAYFEKISQLDAYLSIPHLKIVPYIERMDLAFTAATIIVSRAGAIALSEMALAQKPIILVPSPYVTADHQMKNSIPFVKAGAAIVVKEENIEKDLVSTIISLIGNPEHQNTLKANLAKQAKPNAVEEILEIIQQLIHDHNL